MKKIRAILAAMIVAVGALAAVTEAPAQAAGCSGIYNLPGGWVATGGYGYSEFRLVVQTKECNGYDEVWGVFIDGTHNGECGVVQGGDFVGVAGWTGDPNAIGPWNPAVSDQKDCLYQMADNFKVDAGSWHRGSAVTITSGMAESARCVAATIRTKRSQSQPDFVNTTPRVCLDGY